MKDCTCFAICTDPERQEMWKLIFPPWGQVPLSSPLAEGLAELGQAPDTQIVFYYLIDLARVSADEMEAWLIKAHGRERVENEIINKLTLRWSRGKK